MTEYDLSQNVYSDYVDSLLEAAVYQGSPDRQYKLCNVVSTVRCRKKIIARLQKKKQCLHSDSAHRLYRLINLYKITWFVSRLGKIVVISEFHGINTTRSFVNVSIFRNKCRDIMINSVAPI